MTFGFFSAQNSFSINLKAPEFEKDSLFIAPMNGAGNIQKIYDFHITPGKNIDFKKDYNMATVHVFPENTIKGTIDYPQPVTFSYHNAKQNAGYDSAPIFLEKGDFEITVNKTNNLTATLNSESPTNKEFVQLKEKLKKFDNVLKPYQDNDSQNVEAKEQFLQTYIKSNPNSFAAFWEVVSDFSKYKFNISYLKSLSLFSDEVKKTFSYKEFKKMMDLENSTNIGGNFPDVNFGNNQQITKADFAKHTLTLIDYWSTTCKPCIEDMPQLVKMYSKYKSQGVNFISVTDESQKDRMDVADNILSKNKVTWTNYFDTKKQFPAKLNAAGYPLQILVDQNG